ncbi:hypothetical protein FSP39_003976 [Pinctada imbricata]|uniref:Stabilizer of axonemal microtubules 2 n=1 Tax=Pinctada imbricata TaxID=66713 RepID=A0AA88YVQ9_PINIB|nr:hypothetical protein FSP39_003976 [Pinctada imbricata]
MSICEADILAEQFPDNVSVSDLCECGKCKRRKPNITIQKSKVPFPESDYARTYKAVENPRPRSSKRPADESPRMRPMYSAPMSFSTNQRDDFKNLGRVERTKPIIPEQNYEQLNVPVESTTSYKNEFFAKPLHQEVRRSEPRGTYVSSDAKFDDHTTNKEHFKKWLSQPVTKFTELPSFTGSILFPEREKLPSSETKNQFKGEYARRPSAIRLADANIQMDGDMLLNTTNQDTYKSFPPGDHRAERIVKEPSLQASKIKGKFQSETQNRHDFPAYRNTQTLRARMAEPAPDTIDLKFDNKTSFSTEQRTIYRGHDILKNPVPRPIRHDMEEYQKPTVKFETETSNKRDFQPIDVTANRSMRAIPPYQSLGVPDAKFDDRTMFKEFFKTYSPTQRVRYGDFHENRPYVPPVDKFEGVSTTKTTFIPKKYEPTPAFKPETQSIDTSGRMEFSTVHKDTYTKPKVKPCRAKIFLIQKELMKQKAALAAK